MRELHQVQDDSPERSILARLILSNQQVEADPLEELHGLATTAGTEVMDELVQRRPSADHSTYLGKGKVEELRLMVERHDADLVIFDNDLSPAQTRNLEKAVGAKVLDRTELILDIFAAGARTYESRLAIELAQLEYSLPRLKRMWTHLSRQAMGVGMRGPGEKQLEVDRRLAQKRIHDLKQELSKVEQRRERQVKARKEAPTVSLVGYTNAGKSTLLSRISSARPEIADYPFTTKHPNLGIVDVNEEKSFVVADIPGLVEGASEGVGLGDRFLRHVERCKVLLFLLDMAGTDERDPCDDFEHLQKELADYDERLVDKPYVVVGNKRDEETAEANMDRFRKRFPKIEPFFISAVLEEGLSPLRQNLLEHLR